MSDFVNEHTVTRDEEIGAPLRAAPHVVLLGAGASRAALPDGDLRGRAVPLLQEVAKELNLARLFPNDLRDLARTGFEAAYSRLWDRGAHLTGDINAAVFEYFAQLELPIEPTIYDCMLLSLRDKDAIFTFNWDPFLFDALIRVRKAGVDSLPTVWFLHGNVAVGHCETHDQVRGRPGGSCSHCGRTLEASPLLFPVEKKNYQDGSIIEREWAAARKYLEQAFMFTIFGYSAPATDVEAKELLQQGWGDSQQRSMEQTEIINRPGADHDELRRTWAPFIHTHHYEIHGSFFDSWMARHPRRTCEAFFNQYVEGNFIEDNPIPRDVNTVQGLAGWSEPLFAAERRYVELLSDTSD